MGGVRGHTDVVLAVVVVAIAAVSVAAAVTIFVAAIFVVATILFLLFLLLLLPLLLLLHLLLLLFLLQTSVFLSTALFPFRCGPRPSLRPYFYWLCLHPGRVAFGAMLMVLKAANGGWGRIVSGWTICVWAAEIGTF